MTNVFDVYGTDQGLVDNGAPITMRSGFHITARSFSSQKVREAARQLDKKYRAIILSEQGLPPDIEDQKDIELCATAVVVSWDLTDGNGPIPCTPDSVRDVMTKLPAMRRELMMSIRMDENYRAAQQAAISGN